MTRLYGCHNKPRPTAKSNYVAQQGWSDLADGKLGRPPLRTPVYMVIKASFGSTTCQYDKTRTDPHCTSCVNAPQPNDTSKEKVC